MYTRAVLNDLQFLTTSKSVYESVRDRELVLLPITMDMTLHLVRYPFVLPKTRDFVNAFAKKYREACGERLIVTSAARPRGEQPRNASPKSVHPTGMAIDFRRPSGSCLEFMRDELVLLERQGVLEATEERHPVHFHVAVLQRLTGPLPGRVVASAAADPAPAVATAVPGALTADSAAGSVEASAPKSPPASKASTGKPTARTYTVRKGDNLSTIAKRFGLTVSKLRSLNGMKGSTIKPGQKLKVS